MFIIGMGYRYLSPADPSEYHRRQGDIRLSDGDWSGAIESFDQALQSTPDHHGAKIGRAIALLQSDQLKKAEAAFDALIDGLKDNPGNQVLAAAYANRGILHDRAGRYRQAYDDYIAALRTNNDVVSGPGLIDKVLYGTPNAATVRNRAAYIKQQLALPPEERRLRVPEIDAQQRMHKP